MVGGGGGRVGVRAELTAGITEIIDGGTPLLAMDSDIVAESASRPDREEGWERRMSVREDGDFNAGGQTDPSCRFGQAHIFPLAQNGQVSRLCPVLPKSCIQRPGSNTDLKQHTTSRRCKDSTISGFAVIRPVIKQVNPVINLIPVTGLSLGSHSQSLVCCFRQVS